MKCCLCKKEIDETNTFMSYGNNAQPLADGRCCDICNITKVIPERMKRTFGGKQNE